jgi:hypothetical protein
LEYLHNNGHIHRDIKVGFHHVSFGNIKLIPVAALKIVQLRTGIKQFAELYQFFRAARKKIPVLSVSGSDFYHLAYKYKNLKVDTFAFDAAPAQARIMLRLLEALAPQH